MKVKEESEKLGLKLNIQKTNIVASQVPLSGSGCPCLPVSSGGWAGPQQASSAQFFVL